jgi:hypothetical protein
MDKGRGEGKTIIYKMWIKRSVLFKNPSLREGVKKKPLNL